jgi:hypothetical protein
MTKSELLKLAQVAVLNQEGIGEFDKLEVLRVLMDEEYIARISEKIEEEKKNG